MIYWFRQLPEGAKTQQENEELKSYNWMPFIQNQKLSQNFMRYVYLLQIALIVLSSFLGIWQRFRYVDVFSILVVTFLIHECIHVLVIYTKGDISLTHQGIFFWLNTNAILGQMRFWLFMTLPFLVLTVGTGIIAIFTNGTMREFLFASAWMNAIIAGSDILNSYLILRKPKGCRFFRGTYRLPEKS